MERKFPSFPVAVLAFGMAVSFPQSGRGQIVEAAFIRGDSNIDGEIDIGDAIQIIFCDFTGGNCSSCADAADVNDDKERNLSDPIYLLSYLFLGESPPPAPFEACGTDPTEDEIDCQSFPLCASEDSIPTSRGELLVLPIDHASLVLQWDGKAIYVDPVGGVQLYAGLPPPDIVLVTHTHGDHMSATTLNALVQDGTVLVVPEAVSEALASSGVLDIVEEKVLANGEAVQIGDIHAEAIPMYNLTEERLRYHPKGTGNGYVLGLEGTRVYISGDTEDIPEMRALQDIDLAFICMNLPYTMTPEQAASSVLEFRPRVVYPYHFRGQDPEIFKNLVEAESGEIEVRIRNWYPE